MFVCKSYLKDREALWMASPHSHPIKFSYDDDPSHQPVQAPKFLRLTTDGGLYLISQRTAWSHEEYFPGLKVLLEPFYRPIRICESNRTSNLSQTTKYQKYQSFPGAFSVCKNSCLSKTDPDSSCWQNLSGDGARRRVWIADWGLQSVSRMILTIYSLWSF